MICVERTYIFMQKCVCTIPVFGFVSFELWRYTLFDSNLRGNVDSLHVRGLDKIVYMQSFHHINLYHDYEQPSHHTLLNIQVSVHIINRYCLSPI